MSVASPVSDPSAVSPSQGRLVMTGISKTFGSTVALRNASLSLRAGRVTALMGANGAGKSTLVRILCGIHRADAGNILLDGRPIAPASPRAARALGIIAVHQLVGDVGIPTMTVAENLLLDRFCDPRGRILVGGRAIRDAARQVADAVGLDIDPDRRLDQLSIAEQQLVAIARAVALDPSVLIFDEPTASLSAGEADRLFAVIDRLRDRGAAILYISHRIGDLRRLADEAVVLRDGGVVGRFERPIDFPAAIRTMIGRDIAADGSRQAADPSAPVRLSVEGLRLRPDAAPIDLSVRQGEVIAVTGPVGAGKTSLARILFGARAPAGGRMVLDGRPWAPRSPAEAIRAGVFMAGEDRWRTSLFPAAVPFASIAGTISFPFLARWFPGGVVRPARERRAAEAGIAAYGIRCRGPDDPLDALSGGNQQKVVLARWRAEPARLLLLDEPFHGVDIGARDDIIRAIRRDAADRATIIFVSDTEEALEVGDRIVVMDHHRIIADRPRADTDIAMLLAGGEAGRSPLPMV